MIKRIIILVAVIFVAIFLGVTITVQKVNNHVMLRLINQQTQILGLQKKMEKKLSAKQVSSAQVRAESVADSAAVKALQARVSVLEKKIDALQLLVKSGKGPGRQQGKMQAPPPEDYSKVHQLDKAHSPVQGNKKAPVTIVEFVDFQCPFCARFHGTVTEVLKEYPKKVNYILKNYPLPFHQQAKPAAKAAFAAGEQGKYWEMVDLLLSGDTNFTDEKFEEYAKKIGLKMKKFKKDYADAKWDELIQADMDLGNKSTVRGTPTFFLNGRKTRARDLSAFKDEIDKILKK